MKNFDVTIRPARPIDAQAVARLSISLGYDATPEDTNARLEATLAHEDHVVLVAVDHDDRVVGWIHVFAAPRIESRGFAEIGGLVVDPACRRRGIAGHLVTAAEETAVRLGCSALRVRSRADRRDAHRFFEGCDFCAVKTQRVYEKIVRATPRHQRSRG
jgi:predicted N-acetyltransferase YhbS